MDISGDNGENERIICIIWWYINYSIRMVIDTLIVHKQFVVGGCQGMEIDAWISK